MSTQHDVAATRQATPEDLAGLALAEATADPWWQAGAAAAVGALEASGRPFHAGDVRAQGVGEPDAPDDGMSALFATPKIHTDDEGRHWDDHGREHRMVDVDGEASFESLATGPRRSRGIERSDLGGRWDR